TRLKHNVSSIDNLHTQRIINRRSRPLLTNHNSAVFFFNDTPTTEIYTLSLHDALPISSSPSSRPRRPHWTSCATRSSRTMCVSRSEEHTSELQSQSNLVCRLLLEKKNKLNVIILIVTFCGVVCTTSN